MSTKDAKEFVHTKYWLYANEHGLPLPGERSHDRMVLLESPQGSGLHRLFIMHGVLGLEFGGCDLTPTMDLLAASHRATVGLHASLWV